MRPLVHFVNKMTLRQQCFFVLYFAWTLIAEIVNKMQSVGLCWGWGGLSHGHAEMCLVVRLYVLMDAVDSVAETTWVNSLK